MTENNNAVLPVEKDVFAAPMAGRRDVREQLQAIPIPETSVPDDTPDDGREPIVFLDDIHVTFKTNYKRNWTVFIIMIFDKFPIVELKKSGCHSRHYML